MTIPTRAIRSRATIPASITAKMPAEMTLHGLLAAQLVLFPAAAADAPSRWDELVPSRGDFERTMPFFWPARLQKLLPPEAMKLLRGQQSKAGRDWAMFTASGFRRTDNDDDDAEFAEQDYLHAWFVVGTRSFYYETPETLPYAPHDRLALLPVADMFNHSSTSFCAVTFSADDGYEVTADREYRRGEEVCLSYGVHSNDFLLAEYGFLVCSLNGEDDGNNNNNNNNSSSNPADRICLDDILLARLNSMQQTQLRQRDLLGDFMLGADTPPSDRTWIALRWLTTGLGHESVPPPWELWTAGVEDNEDSLATARAKTLPAVLAEFGEAADVRRRSIATLLREANADDNRDTTAQLKTLLQRWDQIYELAQWLS